MANLIRTVNDISSKPPEPSRRRLLGTAVAAGLGSVTAARRGEAATTDGSVEFADGFANTVAFYKMLTTFGDAPVYGGLIGIFYALIDEDVTPMFGYCGYGLRQSRIVKTPDGGRRIDTRMKEAGFYTDLATGRRLETWSNPWTGEQVSTPPWFEPGRCVGVSAEVPAGGLEVHDFGIQLYGGLMRKPAPADAPPSPMKLAWKRVGDRYLTSSDSSVRFLNPVTPEGWPKASTGKFVVEHELMRCATDAHAIDDPSIPHAPFTGVLTRDVPWFPFLRMGRSNVKGRMIGAGNLYTTTGEVSDVPPIMREYLEREHPDQLEPMTSWAHTTVKPGGTWQYYAKTTPPETPGYNIQS